MNEKPKLIDMIKSVETSLCKLLNYVDRMKSEEKCGDNLSLTCIKLQQVVELFVTRTSNQARFILEFTNMSKKYWAELSDLHKSCQKFNNRLSNNSNHFYAKDPNSTFNTIKASIDTIPILSINESITPTPKSYHYTEVIENMDFWVNTTPLLTPISNKTTTTTTTTTPTTTATLTINNILSSYKSILVSNKHNRDLMPNFMEDLRKIEQFPSANHTLHTMILSNIENVNSILLIQLESSGHDEKSVQSSVNDMQHHCLGLTNVIDLVINTIYEHHINSRVYLLNTILYWRELSEAEQLMTIKTGHHFSQQLPSPSSSSSSSEASKKTKLATFF